MPLLTVCSIESPPEAGGAPHPYVRKHPGDSIPKSGFSSGSPCEALEKPVVVMI